MNVIRKKSVSIVRFTLSIKKTRCFCNINNNYVTLKSPNNVGVDLLVERHFKSSEERKTYNKYIYDKKVKHIIVENLKTTRLGNLKRLFFDKMYDMIQVITHDHFDSRSSIHDAIIRRKNNEINLYDLEFNQKATILDDMLLISTPIFLSSLFMFMITTQSYPVCSVIIGTLSGSNILCHLILRSNFITDYKTKSIISKLFCVDTILYRRDKIMADNIILYANNKNKNDSDTMLCIFGSAHLEGVCYYLTLAGYTQKSSNNA